MKRILLWACCSLPAVTALAATPKLEVEFGASGLTSIKWDGAELLAANSSAGSTTNPCSPASPNGRRRSLQNTRPLLSATWR